MTSLSITSNGMSGDWSLVQIVLSREVDMPGAEVEMQEVSTCSVVREF